MFGEEQGFTISVALGVKVGFVAGHTAPIQGPLSQLLKARLCFDRRAKCNADSCFNFQPDADITHKKPETPENGGQALDGCSSRASELGLEGPAETQPGSRRFPRTEICQP